MTKKFVTVLYFAVMTVGGVAACAQQPQDQQQAQPAEHRTLWIAKFTCEAKAALAVSSSQAAIGNILKYNNLFDKVVTFDIDDEQPDGAWSLSANEIEFDGGSTAERAIVGWGAGRASITMEYKLTDPSGKVVWTSKIKTKPSWMVVGGAIQNQSAAGDEQAQKLSAALSKYFGVGTEKKE